MFVAKVVLTIKCIVRIWTREPTESYDVRCRTIYHIYTEEVLLFLDFYMYRVCMIPLLLVCVFFTLNRVSSLPVDVYYGGP